MTCDRARAWLDAFADGEVRGWRRIALRRHFARCPGCTARLDDVRALRRRIRTEVPVHAAPPALRARVEALRDRGSGARTAHWRGPWPWPWALGGAAAGAALTVLVTLALGPLRGAQEAGDAARAMIDEHARAVVAQRDVVVASPDQHTVKPWLSSHLEFSPPVHDFAAAGFVLQGARIVRLQGRSVAVLAYRHRLHAVDVYVEPAGERGHPSTATAMRGFNLLPLTAQGMDWTIVSDASPEALADLATAIRAAGP